MTDLRPLSPGLAIAALLAGCSNGNIGPEPSDGPPGVQAMSRLNRVEHENTLDDLLGIHSGAASLLPEDPIAHGFDTVAEGLVMTPAYAGHYERITEEALDRFFGVDGPRSPRFTDIVTCDPASGGEACVETIARGLLRSAWRRPPSDEDVAWVVALYDAATGLDAPPMEALRTAMKGVLLAPEFVFRVEPAPAPGATLDLDAFEVATRLAYFLWSSTPDAELLDAAESGALLADGGLRAQIDRMLDDPRADALLENFGGQWLDVRAVMDVQPNPGVHAFFDDYLKRAMQLEMLSIAEPFLRGDEPFDVVLTLQEAQIERRLSQHYRWLYQPGPDGLVQLGDVERLGLLTTAGWLSLTSHPDETSAVRRGHWIMRKLLCDPPPPPPPDVESTVTITPDGSVREQEEQVRSTTACAACHGVMDPLGYTLHGFDAVGLLRDVDRLGYPVDDQVSLEGSDVQGARELVDWLLTDPRLDRCVVQQTFTYALGRDPDAGDDAVIDKVTEAFVAGGRRFPVIIEHLVTSRSFLDVTGPQETTP